jgi:hypothetical protein
VRVAFRLDFGGQPVPTAVVIATIEDVTLADAQSVEMRRHRSRVAAARTDIVLRWRPPADVARRRFALRVHVDVDGDGAVSPGDYVSFQNHAVNPSADTSLQIPLQLVKGSLA